MEPGNGLKSIYEIRKSQKGSYLQIEKEKSNVFYLCSGITIQSNRYSTSKINHHCILTVTSIIYDISQRFNEKWNHRCLVDLVLAAMEVGSAVLLYQKRQRHSTYCIHLLLKIKKMSSTLSDLLATLHHV